MKVKYKGFEIEVTREKSLGGWTQLYYSIFTEDGEEILSSFEDSDEKILDKIKQLKEYVDFYLENKKVKVKFYCGMYVGEPEWRYGFDCYKEPDECCNEGIIEVDR